MYIPNLTFFQQSYVEKYGILTHWVTAWKIIKTPKLIERDDVGSSVQKKRLYRYKDILHVYFVQSRIFIVKIKMPDTNDFAGHCPIYNTCMYTTT